MKCKSKQNLDFISPKPESVLFSSHQSTYNIERTSFYFTLVKCHTCDFYVGKRNFIYYDVQHDLLKYVYIKNS
jgi:hypothetical protein